MGLSTRLVVLLVFSFYKNELSRSASSVTVRPRQTIVVNGITESVQPDTFTKLLIYSDHHGRPDTSDDAVVNEALRLMRGSHCAIKAVGLILEKEKRGQISFKTPQSGDIDGEYRCDAAQGDIAINPTHAQMRDPENLMKILYHEGIHHIDCTRKSSTVPDPKSPRGECDFMGSFYHESKCISEVLAQALPGGKEDACLKTIAADGTLRNADGTLFEPNYALVKISEEKNPGEPPNPLNPLGPPIPPIKLPPLRTESPKLGLADFDGRNPDMR